MATAEIRRHWSLVASLGCAVCQNPQATIHHVHGGTCRGLSGMGMKASDWLVIPLCPQHHTGRFGIDSGLGVVTWEATFGPQLTHLIATALAVKVNVFERANVDLSRLFASCVSR